VSGRLRVMVGAVGLAGHALPAIALARELRARGHEVLFCSYERWRETVEDLGLRFQGGAEQIFDPVAGADGADASVAEVVRALLPSVREFGPDVVVGDGLTLTPGLAAEVAGLPRATLLPEVYPAHAPGLPFFSLGLLPPRTRVGSAAWRALDPALGIRLPSRRWMPRSHLALNDQRRELGLAPRERLDRPPDEELTLVATLPQLEYPREWPPGVHVVGPMFFEPRHPEPALPGGDYPLVVIAPSTVKDPRSRLLRVALEALASEPVRIVVTTGGAQRVPVAIPANAVAADWIDYSRVMPQAAVVVCHGNHGTVTRALAEAAPLAISPALPDDAEHGARVTWSGAGLMIPKPLLTAAAMRAVVRRLLRDRRFGERAGAIAAWSRAHDGAAEGAELVERHAGS
jgi:UDP:flavonoid glycosyltransferase YjiC (YdhE family)